uniref:Uncharacterized protein n=1 Tax=Plectus sambesii TaxID=2011161 RepID=A0A914VEG5_9BILA
MASGGGDQSDFISIQGNGAQYSNAAGPSDFSRGGGGGWRGNRGSGPYRGRGGGGGGRGNNWQGGQSWRGNYQQPRGQQWHRGRGASWQQSRGNHGSSYNEQRASEEFDVTQYYSPAMVQNPWAALERERTATA